MVSPASADARRMAIRSGFPPNDQQADTVAATAQQHLAAGKAPATSGNLFNAFHPTSFLFWAIHGTELSRDRQRLESQHSDGRVHCRGVDTLVGHVFREFRGVISNLAAT